MKKLTSLLLALCLLLSLPVSARAAGGQTKDTGDVTLTALGSVQEQDPDGPGRLRIRISAKNRTRYPVQVWLNTCEICSTELAGAFHLELEPRETAEEDLVVPLDVLQQVDADPFFSDYIRLRFRISVEDDVFSSTTYTTEDWVLRLNAAPVLSPQKSDGIVLLEGNHISVTVLSAIRDGEVLTLHLLVENDGDADIQFHCDETLRSGGAPLENFGGYYRYRCGTPEPMEAHSRRIESLVFVLRDRLTLTYPELDLNCEISSDPQGEWQRMAAQSSTLALTLPGRDAGRCAVTRKSAGRLEKDAAFVKAHGWSDAPGTGAVRLYEIDPQQKPLAALTPSREDRLFSCPAFEIALSSPVRDVKLGKRQYAELDFVVRNYSTDSYFGFGLDLPDGGDNWLPLIYLRRASATASVPAMGVQHFRTEADPAVQLGDREERCSFGMRCGVGNFYEYPRFVWSRVFRFSTGLPETPMKGAASGTRWTAEELRFELLGVNTDDGLSVYLLAENTGREDRWLSSHDVCVTLNGEGLTLANFTPRIPAGQTRVVLLHSSEPEDVHALMEPRFVAPPLKSRNRLVLEMGNCIFGEAPVWTLTLEFSRSGELLSAAAEVPD